MQCETVARVLNENALRFSINTRPAPVLEYINAIASTIGTSHILAVFEDIDSIKVFFDDKRYVDTIIKTSIHVDGQHVKVDYVVPPGVKVHLYKVDPVITNYDLKRLLSLYGKIVSPIISPPLSNDAKLCHISYGERYVHMIIEKQIPERLDFKYGNQFCTIEISVDCDLELPFVKTDYHSDVDYQEDALESPPNPPAISEGESRDPVLVSAQCAAVEEDKTEEKDGNCNTDTASLETETSYKIKKLTINRKHRKGKRMFVPKRTKYISKRKLPTQKRPLQSSTFPRVMSSNENPKPSVVKEEQSSPEMNHSLKENISPGSKCTEGGALPPIIENGTPSTSSQSFSSVKDEEILPPLETSLEMYNSLTDEELLKILDNLKYHRAPLHFLEMYYGKHYNSETLKSLIKQLRDYRLRQTDLNFKLRINRIISLISAAL